MFLIDTETLEVKEIAGTPEIASDGQGGLLDVTVSPDFDEDSLVYLTYSAANEAGATATHLARATLDLNERNLSDLEVLYIAKPFQGGTAHYGSRVVVQGDFLYMTIGDRGDKNFEDHVSHDTTNVLGTTARLLRDGDEINIIRGGNNYGWPIATYGCTYVTGQDIGVFPEELDDTINPVHYWKCGSSGFPPAGMTFYDADGFIAWQGDLFVGGLARLYDEHLPD